MDDHPLRILQVSTVDQGGGAEQAAHSLFQTFRARGLMSWLAVGRKYGDDPDVLPIPKPEPIGVARACRDLERRLETLDAHGRAVSGLRSVIRMLGHPREELESRFGVENFNYPGTRKLLELTPHLPDIIHFHNLHGYYFDLREIPRLAQCAPLVFTLHDAWLLSGHCAHSFECERWRFGCGKCPDLSLYPAINRDATSYNWRRKKNIFERSRIYVSTPSRWLMQKVEQSMLAPAVVDARVIPNAVDLSIFHPADRMAARTALGLPVNATVLLFAAKSLRRNVWKDYSTVRAALAQIANSGHASRLVFLALGEEGPAERIGETELRFIGYQQDREIVARYQQAADLYLHAARAEVWGLSITEALACGTPVVATAVGGIPEQVKGLHFGNPGDCESNRYGIEEATGILVPPGNAQAMARGIDTLLNDEGLRRRLGSNASRSVVDRFSLESQADDFVDWYQHILERWRPEGATTVPPRVT